jgi:radial spoke head protein 9
MELFDLEANVKLVASAGNTLNVHEVLCIQAGLTKLKSNEKYDQIYLWGKIFGENGDYYIAYGLKEADDEFPSKKFYFATESFVFAELPLITEEIADKIIEEHQERLFSGLPDTPLSSDESGTVTELDHLAQVVAEIDFDSAVVPKGAYALNEVHSVVPNVDFNGLASDKATDLANYLHFRPPTSVAKLRALARDDVQFYSNFLDSLDEDLPNGCWAIRKDSSTSLATLRSLSWPGYVAFHIQGTKKFGGLYFGYAQKNRDLPFLL